MGKSWEEDLKEKDQRTWEEIKALNKSNEEMTKSEPSPHPEVKSPAEGKKERFRMKWEKFGFSDVE